MVEISKSGSGEGPGGVIPRGYSTISNGADSSPTHTVFQAPIALDAGRPTSVIRFRMLQATIASASCDFG